MRNQTNKNQSVSQEDKDSLAFLENQAGEGKKWLKKSQVKIKVAQSKDNDNKALKLMEKELENI